MEEPDVVVSNYKAGCHMESLPLSTEEPLMLAESPTPSIWAVVGGTDKGGIIVREGRELASPELGRLSTGSLLRALETPIGGRLHYELLNGTGPSYGWVSLSVSGKDLVILAAVKDGQQDDGELGTALDAEAMPAHGVPEGIDNYNAEDALQCYSQRFKSVDADGAYPLFNRKAFPWRTVVDGPGKRVIEEKVCAELERELGLKVDAHGDGKDVKTSEAQRQKYVNMLINKHKDIMSYKESPTAGTSAQNGQQTTWAEDSDKERVWLCVQCGLPLGECSYSVDDHKGAHVHGECMAQRLLRDMKKDDKGRLHKERELKNSRRKEFEIGWKTSQIPLNIALAEEMGCLSAARGMCCLVLDESAHTVHVAPTIEPAASVNLKYLSIALKVRREEDREPLFSLDPVDPTGADSSMQVKRFEPEWLAGTCVGDVLFQADYHLKELSMGEYEQPVIGMRSCFDYSWDEGYDAEWRGREWFVVRKAEVHISNDNVLMPHVRMAVEAWEQVVDADGMLEDAKVTRTDHPLLKYAQSFTRNFDLIAERKSVVFHLRELAKASVLAKYLVDASVHVPDAWFQLGDEVRPEETIKLEIPQLWNERHVGKIRVKDGAIVDGGNGVTPCRHGVYGGVSFGLSRFDVAAPARVSRSGGISALPPAHGIGALPGQMAMVQASPGFTARRAVGPGSWITPKRVGAAQQLVAAPKRVASAGQWVAPQAAPKAAPSPPAWAARPERPVSEPQWAPPPSAEQWVAPQRAVSAQQQWAPPPSAGEWVAPRRRASAGKGQLVERPAGAAEFVAPVSAGQFVLSTRAAGVGQWVTPGVPGVAPVSLTMLPQGVDLNLDKFDLTKPTRVANEAPAVRLGENMCAAIGDVFWSNVDNDRDSTFKDEDKGLLSDLFNPCLSDRRKEGDKFVPPDTGRTYIDRLSSLMKAEEEVRMERIKEFCSTKFDANNPGPLFPSSWKDMFEIEGTNDSGKAFVAPQEGTLHARPDYKAEAHRFDHLLKTAAPVFQRSTEEGIRFRVYRVGSLEVRTTQKPKAEESVMAVFSVRASLQSFSQGKQGQKVKEHEQIAKATMYVERDQRWADYSRYYLVLETVPGNRIVTEQLWDGTIAWKENQDDLDDRNSLAKAFRTKGCRSNGVTVKDMMSYQTRASDRRKGGTSHCTGKRYAQGGYDRANGEMPNSNSYGREKVWRPRTSEPQ